MMFQTIFPRIPLKEFINDYFNHSRVLSDVNVNDLLADAIEYNIQKTLNLYGDFEMLYDEKYTLDNIEYILISYIPELTSCLLKNDLITSDVFISYTNMKDRFENESKTSNSYEGLNADSNYMNTTNNSKNTNHNPLRTLMMLNQEFKKTLDVIKVEIEKLLQTIY